MRPHEGIIESNAGASMIISQLWNANITKVPTGQDEHGRPTSRTVCYGSRISARLCFGSIDYWGYGATVAAALADLDADIEASAQDCDCVLPTHACGVCCPKEVTSADIFF